MSRRDVLLLVAAGAGIILSLPPFPTGPLAFAALIPAFLFIREKSLKTAVAGGLFLGCLIACGTVYWISWATIPGFAGSLLVVAPQYGLLFLLLSLLHRRFGDNAFWAAPFLYTGMEILSSWGELAFPWNLIAYSLSSYPVLIQSASLFGVWFVSFGIVLVNVIILRALVTDSRQRRITCLAVLIILFGTVWGTGNRSLSRKTAVSKETIRVSIIQGNIDPYRQWTTSFVDSNFSAYARLTQQSEHFDPDLVIWPETAAPCFLRYRHEYYRPIREQLRSLNTSLVTGSADYNFRTKEQYNASFLLRPDRSSFDVYYKRRLVPFSERVPFSRLLPDAYRWTRKIFITVGNFTAGDSAAAFRIFAPSLKDTVIVTPVICFDSVFPETVRDAVKSDADLLVIQTNDGWFGNTSGPYQHAQMAVFRAVENRIWIARAANTGISSFIDPYGRVVKKTGLSVSGTLHAETGLRQTKSYFTRSGHRFALLIQLINGVLILSLIIPFRRQRHEN